MRRTGIDDDGASTLAGAPAPSSGPPLGPTVIKFPRRTEAAASEGSAGCSETSSEHPFIPLGTAVSAVVLRVGNSRLRVQALVPSTVGAGGKDGTRDDGPGED